MLHFVTTIITAESGLQEIYESTGLAAIETYMELHASDGMNLIHGNSGLIGLIFPNIIPVLNAILYAVLICTIGFTANIMCDSSIFCKYIITPFALLEIISAFKTVCKIALTTLQTLTGFVNVSVPLLFTFNTAVSKRTVATAALNMAEGLTVPFAVQIFANLTIMFFLPVGLLACIIGICGVFAHSGNQLCDIGALIRKSLIWIYSVGLTVLGVLITAQCSITGRIGKTAIKTAKLAIGSGVPIAGKYISEVSDYLLESLGAISELAGTSITIGVISIILIPFLQIMIIYLAFKLLCFLCRGLKIGTIEKGVESIAEICGYFGGIIAGGGVWTIVVSLALCSVTERLAG